MSNDNETKDDSKNESPAQILQRLGIAELAMELFTSEKNKNTEKSDQVLDLSQTKI